MSSVDALLTHLHAVDEAVDFVADPPDGTPHPVLDAILRGAAVQTLAALEDFFRERGVEWSLALTSARLDPTRLPGGFMPFQDRLLKIFPKSYNETDAVQRGQFALRVSKTLTSFSTSAVEAHDLFFGWNGSNLQSSDIADLIQLSGVPSGWDELTKLWLRVENRQPGQSASSLFRQITDLRHPAAHQPQPVLPLANMQTLTRNARLTALLVDSTVSVSFLSFMRGQGAVKNLGNSVQIRRIEQDGAKWAEFSPKVKRAKKRYASLADAIVEAAPRAKSAGELLIAYDKTGVVVDWRTPV